MEAGLGGRRFELPIPAKEGTPDLPFHRAQVRGTGKVWSELQELFFFSVETVDKPLCPCLLK